MGTTGFDNTGASRHETTMTTMTAREELVGDDDDA
jgi:hypothetical protein